MWSIFLNVQPESHARYKALVEKGPSDDYEKIRNDTFRTMATDSDFTNKVSESALIRLLNSFVWSQKLRNARDPDFWGSTNSPSSKRRIRTPNANGPGKTSSVAYFQGMNVIAAPFLYVARSESQAFYLYEAFLTKFCPLYIKPSLPGAHAAFDVS